MEDNRSPSPPSRGRGDVEAPRRASKRLLWRTAGQTAVDGGDSSSIPAYVNPRLVQRRE